MLCCPRYLKVMLTPSAMLVRSSKLLINCRLVGLSCVCRCHYGWPEVVLGWRVDEVKFLLLFAIALIYKKMGTVLLAKLRLT